MISQIFSSLVRPKPLLDENSAQWLYDAFAWAIVQFDRDEFLLRSRLVKPNNQFFPGQVSSVDEKAHNVFGHTLQYAGLAHWPIALRSVMQAQNDLACQQPPIPQSALLPVSRNSSAQDVVPLEAENLSPLFVFYNPQQTLKPGDLAASYSHVLAQHLMLQQQSLPPGGQDFFLEGAEVLAHVMGFGLLLANSAYTFRGGCGSCYNALANRQPALNEPQSVFALALYCRLKTIPDQQVKPYLKKHLWSSYRLAQRQIARDFSDQNVLPALQAL